MADYTPSGLILPSELKHRIAELSSPQSLVSLACTHTAYRSAAERALYRTLSIRISGGNPLACIETLASNPEKAGLVRSLSMECARNKTEVNRKGMNYLLKGLTNMHRLSDLRVRIGPNDAKEWVERMDKTLCEGHFQLQTLYCNHYLDISRIIGSQPELQILGIYAIDSPGNLLKTLKQLHTAQLSIPTIFTMERESFYPAFDHISIFPVFCPVDRRATIHRALAKSFDEDRGSDMRTDVDKVSQLSIYLVDISDLATIHVLAKDMAASFPHITWLNFLFERRCEIPSQKIKEIICFFSDLHELNFSPWPPNYRNTDQQIPEDVMRAHTKEWEVACPELISVSFIGGASLQKRYNTGDEWVLYK